MAGQAGISTEQQFQKDQEGEGEEQEQLPQEYRCDYFLGVLEVKGIMATNIVTWCTKRMEKIRMKVSVFFAEEGSLIETELPSLAFGRDDCTETDRCGMTVQIPYQGVGRHIFHGDHYIEAEENDVPRTAYGESSAQIITFAGSD